MTIGTATGKHLYQALANLGFWLAVASIIGIGLVSSTHNEDVREAVVAEWFVDADDGAREWLQLHLEVMKRNCELSLAFLVVTTVIGMSTCLVGCLAWYYKIQVVEDRTRTGQSAEDDGN